jgi:hypothetical protein
MSRDIFLEKLLFYSFEKYSRPILGIQDVKNNLSCHTG